MYLPGGQRRKGEGGKFSVGARGRVVSSLDGNKEGKEKEKEERKK